MSEPGKGDHIFKERFHGDQVWKNQKSSHSEILVLQDDDMGLSRVMTLHILWLYSEEVE